ncbi:hypothetical protein CI610_01264 [invertebrate metagenome]|uniref:Uncharacterized protein n=1 Tax=invertebrate metagenome TaxID=1711999 RepID=A0A2H9T956_9ZZZZ
MSGSIQGPGSQPLTTTTIGAESGAALSKGVGKGAVGDAALNMLQSEKTVAQSQIEHRPALAKPVSPTKTSQSEAKTELAELNTISEEAEADVANLLKALKEGKLSPEQKQQLNSWGVDLEDTGNYLEMLKGKNLDNPKNQRFLLASMGQKQAEDVMSLRDPKVLQQALTDKYGKAGLAEQIKDLKSLGYNESQIKSMLTMASPHKVDAQLLSKYPAGTKEHKLASLGFNKNQMTELLALLKGGTTPKGSMVNNQFFRDLLGKAGFSKTEIDMLLATSDKNAMSKMIQHGQDFSKDQIDDFLVAGHLFKTMASKTNPVMPEHLDQLSMIFEVLTLLHKMGARERQTSRLTRQIAYDGAKKAIEDQADEIRKAATKTMVAEVVGGAMSITGGMASIGGAVGGGPKGGTGKTGSQNGKSGMAGKADDIELSNQKSSSKQKNNNSKGKGVKGNVDGQTQQPSAGGKTKNNTGKQSKDLEGQMNEASSQKADTKAEQQTIQNRQKTDIKRDQMKTDIKQNQQNDQVTTNSVKNAQTDGAGVPTKPGTGIRDGAAGRAGQVRQNTQVNNGKMNPNHSRYDKSPGQSSVTGKRIPSQRELDVKEFRSGNYNRDGKQMNWKNFQEAKYGKGNFEKKAQAKTEQQTGVGRSNNQLGSKDNAKQPTGTNNRQTQANKQKADLENQQANGKTSNKQAEDNQQMSLQDRKKAELKRVNERFGGKSDSEGGTSGKISGTSTPTVGGKTNTTKGGGQGKSGQGKSDKAEFEQANMKQESAKGDKKSADSKADKAKKDAKAGDAAKKADMEQAQMESAQMQRRTTIAQGFGQVLNGLGQVTSGIIKYQAAEHNARERELQAVQKAYENAATSSGEMMQNHHELVKNALGKFEEIERTTADTLRNLARG